MRNLIVSLFVLCLIQSCQTNRQEKSKPFEIDIEKWYSVNVEDIKSECEIKKYILRDFLLQLKEEKLRRVLLDSVLLHIKTIPADEQVFISEIMNKGYSFYSVVLRFTKMRKAVYANYYEKEEGFKLTIEEDVDIKPTLKLECEEDVIMNHPEYSSLERAIIVTSWKEGKFETLKIFGK
ncbi:hypothetical protein [Saprospira grandis]|uniref:Lipoprotein n=1 Tax=Saprospira grandis (strain Lewin) TaxID=984262 RepID=H6L7I1_SAPGL|nr:hypothetical protein [Saprospira grandis]AFC26932.1 hypothetical protein SGRA_4217 [Saprospira grandis str. Lewin]